MKPFFLLSTAIAFCLVVCFAGNIHAVQEQAPTPAIAVKEATDGFHRSVVSTAAKMVREGKMKRGDLVRLRVAMLSPAFRHHAEDLAVTQMSASGSDSVPMSDDGTIDRASIDWDKLFAFIEKLIPLILQLIDAFTQVDGIQFHFDVSGAPTHAIVKCGAFQFRVCA